MSDDRFERIDRHLSSSLISSRRLSADEIARSYPKFSAAAGWRVDLDEKHIVDVLLENDYPYRCARIGIAPLMSDVPRSRVFVDKTLCLFKGNESHSLNDDERVLDELLNRTKTLLLAEDNECSADRNAQEIVDYWNKSEGDKRIVSICQVEARPKVVFYSTATPFALIGDTASTVEHWVRRYRDMARVNVERTAFLVSDTKFPVGIDKANLLYEWFQRAHPEQMDFIDVVAEGDPVSKPLIIAITEAEGGIALLGCWVTRGKGHRFRKTAPLVTPGFRRGKAPGNVAAPYFFSADAVMEKLPAERADPWWLTERGGDHSSSRLCASRVTLIGCGSLGSSLARLLVKAGAQDLILIDPQILSWDNISRHELGGRYVGRSKSKALAESIMRDFPHVNARAIFDNWQAAYREENGLLLERDIVVSTTGDFAGDIQLSDTAISTEGFPRLAVAWLEPFAAAAHVLSIVRGGCLRCGCDEFGVFENACTTWTGDTYRYEPGCSASWQPYSEVEAFPAKAFVGRTVANLVDSPRDDSCLFTWIAPQNVRSSHGGALSDAWVAARGNPPQDGATYEITWQPRCGSCVKAA